MAWRARPGLKRSGGQNDSVAYWRVNGLGSPSGIEKRKKPPEARRGLRCKKAWGARPGLKRFAATSTELCLRRLNGLGSPSGFETSHDLLRPLPTVGWLNGLGSPSGFETCPSTPKEAGHCRLNGLGSPSGIE